MKRILLSILFILFMSVHCFASEMDPNAYLKGELLWDDSEVLSDWQAFFSLDSGKFSLGIGRKQLNWGVGETGSLIMSTTSPAFSLFEYKFEWKGVQYEHFIGALERENNRWFLGHRFGGSLTPNFEISLWELMLVSEEVFPGYYIPVPGVPFYAIQHLAYKTSGLVHDYNTNVMIGGDFRWKVSKTTDVYGELLIDDFPQRSTNNNPEKAGGILGVKWITPIKNVTLFSEYLRLNNYVYTHRNPNNRFLYHGQPFGHWLGMDGDLMAVGLKYKLSSTDQLNAQFHSIRKGEGDYTDKWNYLEGNEYKFLSGVIEYTQQISLDYDFKLRDNVMVELGSNIGISQNSDHIQGNKKAFLDFQVGLKVEYNWF